MVTTGDGFMAGYCSLDGWLLRSWWLVTAVLTDGFCVFDGWLLQAMGSWLVTAALMAGYCGLGGWLLRS